MRDALGNDLETYKAMRMIYFDVGSIKKWVAFFALSASCAISGILVSSYLISGLSEEAVDTISGDRYVSTIFITLFITGHLLGDRLLIIKKTADEKGGVVLQKSGTIVVFWIIITTGIIKILGLLFQRFGVISGGDNVLSWNVVAACLIAVPALIFVRMVAKVSGRSSGETEPR